MSARCHSSVLTRGTAGARQRLPISSGLLPVAFHQQRFVGWYGTGHEFRKEMRVEQSDGVDPHHRVKADQHMYQNTEQWSGYSETYLRRFMQYMPQQTNMNSTKQYREILLKGMLQEIWSIYGDAADILEDLEDNPLDAQFHVKIRAAAVKMKEFEKYIDVNYADLHPTWKTMMDAWCVRRVYVLEDWIKMVQKKRARVLEKLSPEFIEKQQKLVGIAAGYAGALEEMGKMLEADPLAGMPDAIKERLSEEELVVVRRNQQYFRATARHARGRTIAEAQPW